MPYLSSPRRNTRRGFTLIELLVVIAIIATLVGLLLPAVQATREAAARNQCQNNLKQMGLAVNNFYTAQGVFPRDGEHLVVHPTLGTVNTQDLQSLYTVILPYIEQQNLFDQYDLTKRYNDTTAPANQTVAQTVIKTFICPTNPLRPSTKDNNGYACVDYATTPYSSIGGTKEAAAFMGQPYAIGLYTNYTTSDTSVATNKTLQLDTTLGAIDPYYGGATVGAIKDGTAYTVAIYEDVGRGDALAETSGAYLDPVTLQQRKGWRWAEPDNASGVSGKINNNKTPWMGPTTCPWTKHDCGPNNEPFSFHNGGGCHFLFVDGHVTFIRDTIDTATVRAIVTRAGGDTWSID